MRWTALPKEARIDLNIPHLTGLAVVPGQQCPLTAGIEYIRIGRRLGNVTAFSSTNSIIPAMIGTARLHMIPSVTGYGQGAVVLLGTGDMIGNIAGRHNMVNLRSTIIFFGPGLTSIETDDTSSIIPTDHALRIIRIDPQVVIITMWWIYGNVKILSAVGGFKEAHIEAIDDIFIPGVSIDA